MVWRDPIFSYGDSEHEAPGLEERWLLSCCTCWSSKMSTSVIWQCWKVQYIASHAAFSMGTFTDSPSEWLCRVFSIWLWPHCEEVLSVNPWGIGLYMNRGECEAFSSELLMHWICAGRRCHINSRIVVLCWDCASSLESSWRSKLMADEQGESDMISREYLLRIRRGRIWGMVGGKQVSVNIQLQ